MRFFFRNAHGGRSGATSLSLLDELRWPAGNGGLIEAFWRTLTADLAGSSNKPPDTGIWDCHFAPSDCTTSRRGFASNRRWNRMQRL